MWLKFVPGFFFRAGRSSLGPTPARLFPREGVCALKVDIKEAVAYFKSNQETIPVGTIRKGDYAFAIKPEEHLYLVVEKAGKGIFLARLAPDLLRVKPLAPDKEQEARLYARQRLAQAGLL